MKVKETWRWEGEKGTEWWQAERFTKQEGRGLKMEGRGVKYVSWCFYTQKGVGRRMKEKQDKRKNEKRQKREKDRLKKKEAD